MRQQSLEAFLEDAFRAITPTSNTIGRVTVDPDYAATADDSDSSGLADELIRCIRQGTPDFDAVRSPQGYDIHVSEDYPLIRKYFHTITLHNTDANGPWVQVLPPGQPM